MQGNAESTPSVNWGRTLSSVSWRVDLAEYGRNKSSIGEAVGIIQLKLHNPQSSPSPSQSSSGTDLLVMEMDKNVLNTVVAQLKQIEAVIESQTS